MEILSSTVEVSGSTYVLVEEEGAERLTILDARLLPVGQVTTLFGSAAYGYCSTPLSAGALPTTSGHATWWDALDALVPGLYDALVN